MEPLSGDSHLFRYNSGLRERETYHLVGQLGVKTFQYYIRNVHVTTWKQHVDPSILDKKW